MAAPLEFVVGGGEREHLVVRLMGRKYPDEFDADDGNWIHGRVEIVVGAFRGEIACNLRTEDFARFLLQVRQLETDLVGPAEFSTMEGQLGFHIGGDGRGHLTARGYVLDRPGLGNRLDWSLHLDQSYLPGIISAVTSIVASYEVRGR
jgi:hypothetical protein